MNMQMSTLWHISISHQILLVPTISRHLILCMTLPAGVTSLYMFQINAGNAWDILGILLDIGTHYLLLAIRSVALVLLSVPKMLLLPSQVNNTSNSMHKGGGIIASFPQCWFSIHPYLVAWMVQWADQTHRCAGKHQPVIDGIIPANSK